MLRSIRLGYQLKLFGKPLATSNANLTHKVLKTSFARLYTVHSKKSHSLLEHNTSGMVAVSSDSTMDIYRFPALQSKPILQVDNAHISHLNFNSNGSLLLAGLADQGNIFRWKIPTGESLKPIKVKSNHSIESVTANADGSLVAVWYSIYDRINNHGIQLFKKDDPVPYVLGCKNGHPYFQTRITSLAFNPNGSFLVSGHWNSRFLNFWDINSLKQNTVNKPIESIALGSDKTLDYNPTNLVFDSLGSTLATGNMVSTDETRPGCTGFLLDLLNLRNPIPLILPKYWNNTCIAFSPNDQTLATGGIHYKSDKKPYAATRLWDTQGNLLNAKQLEKPDSPFLGRKRTETKFVAFDITGPTQRVISVDTLNGVGDDLIRTCTVDGTQGLNVDRYSKIIAFSYPKTRKETRSEPIGKKLNL